MCSHAFWCNDFYKLGTELWLWAFLLHPLDWTFQMCREVNWTTPSKKWQRRRDTPWTAARRWVTSNNPLVMLNTNLFLTAALLNHMHQQQIPPPQNTPLGTDFYPPRKRLALSFQSNVPSPRQLNAFLSFSVAEATDILPCPSTRRERISFKKL